MARMAVLLGSLAVACVTVPRTEQLSTRDKPKAGSGYIAGRFSKTEGGEYAFVIRGDDGSERTVAFDGTASRGERTGITAVPPGIYRVKGWYHSLSGLGDDRPEKNGINDRHPFGQPFEVEAGHVVFLGSFRASGGIISRTPSMTQDLWTVRADEVHADEVLRILEQAYPAFVDLPVECVLCLAPEDATAAAALPAKLPSIKAGTKVVLHFHRPDGDYQGWGLWAWETSLPWSDRWNAYPGRPPGGMRTLPAFSDKHPAAPAGVDAFGAYWVIDAGEFGDARVNFVLLGPGAAATLEEQRFWVIFDSKQAWVNADDGFLYLTQGDAERWWPK